jgi:hypothetical protein
MPTTYPDLDSVPTGSWARDRASGEWIAVADLPQRRQPRPESTGLVKLAEQIAGVGGVASFDFVGIPSNYKRLRLVTSLRTTAAATFDTVAVAVNGDTTDANYRAESTHANATTNTAAQSIGAAGARAQFFASGATSTAGDFADATVDVPNYSRTDRTKNLLVENQGLLARTSGGFFVRRVLLAWLSTAAVDRLTLSPGTGGVLFVEGSTVALYGEDDDA